MDERALPGELRHQMRIVAAAGGTVREGTRVLDLGCGDGSKVRALRAQGLDAWGCDIRMYTGEAARELIEQGFVKPIPLDPYRLPFDDRRFDLILSTEVLEHVMNPSEFIAESHRVLAPGGMALHIFPGPWTPLEMHTFVPLASVHRSHPWLLLWAALGIRNSFQRGMNARDTARANFEYLRDHTTYPSCGEVLRRFRTRFSRAEFREDLFLSLAESSRARLVRDAVRLMPPLVWAYRNFHNRVLVVVR